MDQEVRNNLDNIGEGVEVDRSPEEMGSLEGGEYDEGGQSLEQAADTVLVNMANRFEDTIITLVPEDENVDEITQEALSEMTEVFQGYIKEISETLGVSEEELEETVLAELPPDITRSFDSGEQEAEVISSKDLEEIEAQESSESPEKTPSLPIEARSAQSFPEVSIKDPENGEELKLLPIEKLKPGGQKIVVVYESEKGDRYAVAFARDGEAGTDLNNRLLTREAEFLKKLNEAGVEKVPELYSFSGNDSGSVASSIEGLDSNQAFIMEYVEDAEGADIMEQLDQVVETLQQIHEAGISHSDFHLSQVLGGMTSDFGMSIQEMEATEINERQLKEIVTYYLSGTPSKSSESGIIGDLGKRLNGLIRDFRDGNLSVKTVEALFEAAKKKDVRSLVYSSLKEKISSKESESEDYSLDLAPAFGISSNNIEAYQRNSNKEKKEINFDNLQRANRRLFGLLNQLDEVQLPPSVLANMYPSDSLEEINSVRSDVKTAYEGFQDSLFDKVKNFFSSSEFELNNENMGLKDYLEYLEESPEAADIIYLINKVIYEHQEEFVDEVGREDADDSILYNFFKGRDEISDDLLELIEQSGSTSDHEKLGEEILNIHN